MTTHTIPAVSTAMNVTLNTNNNNSMKTDKILITPYLAKQMLETNTAINRRVSDRTVAKYASEMQKGQWIEDNGEFIKFDKRGQLIDGQHRLLAVVKSNCTIRMWVTKDVDERAFLTIDTGLPRSISAIVGISGITMASQKTSIIRSLIRYRNFSTSDKFAVPTATDVIRLYNEEKNLIDEVTHIANALAKRNAIAIPESIIGGFLALLIQKHPIIEDFFIELMTGRNITNNAVYLLRERIISASSNSKMVLPKTSKEILVLKAFVHYKNKYQAKKLRVSEDEDIKSIFMQALK